MGKPEFIINSNTGKKLINWCNQGISIDKIKEQINTCESLEALKQIYNQYPNLSKELYPVVMSRKEVIDAVSNQLIDSHSVIENNNPNLIPEENEFSTT
jgi:hypothetical protein